MIKLIAVGKVKEPYLTAAILEYSKRLSPYTRLEMIQVPDEKCPENLSEALKQQVTEKEGRQILSHIADRDYVISLEIR